MRTRLLVFLIVLGGTLLRGQDMFKPWVGNHTAWGGAMYGKIARNYVKFGYGATQFGPVTNGGHAHPSEYEYYYHYPCLTVWMASACHHIFGVHEWSTRLMPLLFSLALLWLIYAFARRLFDERVALLALLFAAFMPGENLYGAHLDPYGSASVFFALLAVHGYARWLSGRKAPDFALFLVAILLGCLTTWYTYFLIPLVGIHYYWFHFRHDEARDYGPLLAPAIAIAVFAGFMLHRQLLLPGRSEVHGGLLAKLLWRMGLASDIGDVPPLDDSLLVHARHMVRMFTPVLLLPAFGWLICFVRRLRRKRAEQRDSYILLLFGFGILHNAVFSGLLGGHDYLARCYTPAIAVSAAVFLVDVYRARSSQVARALVATTVAAVVVTGVYFTQHFYSWGPDDAYAARDVGETIRRHTDERDVILLGTPRELHHPLVDWYYDRKIEIEIDSIEDIERVRRDKGRKYFYVCTKGDTERLADFLRRMDGRYKKVRESDPVIYSVGSGGS